MALSVGRARHRLHSQTDRCQSPVMASTSRSQTFLDYELAPPIPPPRQFSGRDSQLTTGDASVPDYSFRWTDLSDYGSGRRGDAEARPESQSSTYSSASACSRSSGQKPPPPVKPPRKSLSVNKSATCSAVRDYRTDDRRRAHSAAGNDRNCDTDLTAPVRPAPPPSQQTRQTSSAFKEDLRRRLMEESDFSLLYDQIANGLSPVNSNPNNGSSSSSSLNRPTVRGPHLSSHNRSKSEHHPNFYIGSALLLSSDNLLGRTKRATVQIPINGDNDEQNHFNGQTTPDYEPPSPGTAENGVRAVIQPLCLLKLKKADHNHLRSCHLHGTRDTNYFNCFDNDHDINNFDDDCDTLLDSIALLEYKRLCTKSSRDIETLTEDELFATLDSSGYIRLSFRKSSNDSGSDSLPKKSLSVSTDSSDFPVYVSHTLGHRRSGGSHYKYCETLKLDRSGERENPFAGLCRGSVSTNNHHQQPVARRRETTTDGRRSLRRQKNISCDAIYYTIRRNKHRKCRSMEAGGGSIDRSAKQRPVIKSNSSLDDKSGEERRSDLSSMLSGSPFDENAEWAEIANIMASFGSSIGRDSVLAGDSGLSKESTPTNYEDQTVEEWLSKIGLSEYANLLIVNGFDDIVFMGSNVMDDTDLLEIGVINALHRDRILLEASKLPKVKPLADGSTLTVDEWLESLKLGEHRGSFRANGYDQMARVRNLWEVELNTVLEINKLGHRKRILASLGERPKLVADLEFNDLDFDKLNLNISELAVEEPSKQLSNVPNSSRSEPQYSSSASKSITNPQSTSIRNSDTWHRQRLSISHKWRHENSKLTQESCRYTAKYLGSTLVRELHGTDSTKASIQKLKQSTKNISKIPSIMLSISHTGVQFIDAETQKLVCEHEIRNIHCICQDNDDLNHFAYITKELETNNHYCHVFSAQNMELATEVILTFGQAFEIAYQMALESGKFTIDNKADTSDDNRSKAIVNKSKSQCDKSLSANTIVNSKSSCSDNTTIKVQKQQQSANKSSDEYNNKENAKKQTHITTISITINNNDSEQYSDHNSDSRTKRTPTQSDQSSLNAIADSKFQSKSSSSSSSTQITIPTVVKVVPSSSKPSPPTPPASAVSSKLRAIRPTPSPKPTTIPKPKPNVTTITTTTSTKGAKPVPPFKPHNIVDKAKQSKVMQ